MVKKLLKPGEFVEKQLLEAILGSRYKPGESLPAERLLAAELGVTRPTLRETLQRLSKEGWITIQHGKPTKVNDYLKKGGLGILMMRKLMDDIKYNITPTGNELRLTKIRDKSTDSWVKNRYETLNIKTKFTFASILILLLSIFIGIGFIFPLTLMMWLIPAED